MGPDEVEVEGALGKKPLLLGKAEGLAPPDLAIRLPTH